VTSLADPNTLLFDHLLTLKPVKFLEGELIHDVCILTDKSVLLILQGAVLFIIDTSVRLSLAGIV